MDKIKSPTDMTLCDVMVVGHTLGKCTSSGSAGNIYYIGVCISKSVFKYCLLYSVYILYFHFIFQVTVTTSTLQSFCACDDQLLCE